MLFCAIVVTRDRTRADVRLLAHVSVTDVAEVAHLDATAQAGVLHLRVVADVDAAGEASAGAYMTVWSHVHIILQRRLLNSRRHDLAAFADSRIAHRAVRADAGVIADSRNAAQVRIRFNHRVLPDLHVCVDVRRRRVGDRHARKQMAAVDALAHQRLRFSELGAVVDPLHLARFVDSHRYYGRALPGGERDQRRQVAFASGRRWNRFDVRPEPGGAEAVLAGVDLRGPLRHSAALRRLDDVRHAAITVALDTAVGAGLVHLCGEKRHVAGGIDVLSRQRCERFRRDQRHVAVQDQHVLGVANSVFSRCQGMAGTERLSLYGVLDSFTQRRAQIAGVRTYDDDAAAEAGRARRVDDVAHHGPASERMENFCYSRAHALPLACRQDYYCPVIEGWGEGSGHKVRGGRRSQSTGRAACCSSVADHNEATGARAGAVMRAQDNSSSYHCRMGAMLRRVVVVRSFHVRGSHSCPTNRYRSERSVGCRLW